MHTKKTSPRRGKRKVLIIVLSVIFALALVISVALCIYGYINLHYDEFDMKKVWEAGFTEKQAELGNGTTLNYAEGPDEQGNKTALLLIHGQGMAWEDYARVLPELAEEYHIYAVDCHGHGSSSHNSFGEESRYSCKAMTEDFIWFIENIIGEPCVVSGHSSGGILAANVAANSPENIIGVVLEDPPFFSVLPEEMQNTFVWKDGFEVTHNFLNQTEEKYYVPYYFKNGYFWKLFQGLEEFPAEKAKAYSEKYQKECKKIWYMPYSWTHGLLYTDEYDKEFSETFYDGTWFEGVSQEEMLQGIQCPCVYIKAKTDYGEDGVLYAANDDEDAKRVLDLVKDCEYVETDTSDHDIHFKYSDRFIEILVNFNKDLGMNNE